MKTLIFICILAVVAADLNAQIEKISKSTGTCGFRMTDINAFKSLTH